MLFKKIPFKVEAYIFQYTVEVLLSSLARKLAFARGGSSRRVRVLVPREKKRTTDTEYIM